MLIDCVMFIDLVKGLQNPASPSQQSIASSQNISGAISLCAGIMPQLHQILQHGQRQQVKALYLQH